MTQKVFVGVLILAIFVIGYYALSPLFQNVTLDEPVPSGVELLSEEKKEELEKEMAQARELPASVMDEIMPKVLSEKIKPLLEEDQTEEREMEKTSETLLPLMDEMVSEERESVLVAEQEEMEVELVIQRFPIMGTTGHPASGSIRVLETAEGTVIRYEDLTTINGPNLHVYVAKDLRATDFIDLGPIRGTRGNINYVVPEGIDLEEYKYVMYWCVPFRVLFNYAELP